MPTLRMNACAASILLLTMSVAGCASRSESHRPTPSCPRPPAPAAWAMQPASNSVSELDNLFGISEQE
ncbi:Lipoprotein Rz1 precursor [compost metagenome]